MTKLIAHFIHNTEGQDLIEYVLLGALIALGCFTAMGILGGIVSAKFLAIGDSVSSAS
jgi:Flp pilus assembly pilin Flp